MHCIANHGSLDKKAMAIFAPDEISPNTYVKIYEKIKTGIATSTQISD
jgi:hypothetical protein